MKKKKKEFLGIIGILMIIIILILIVNNSKEYSSIYEYIDEEYNGLEVECFEKDNYIYVIGEYKSSSNLRTALLKRSGDGTVKPIDSKVGFSNKKYFNVGASKECLAMHIIIKVDEDYIVIAKFNWLDEKNAEDNKCVISDEFGGWEQIYVANHVQYFFTVISEIDKKYQAYLLKDGKENNFINNEDIKFFFKKGTSQTDIYEYCKVIQNK